MKNKRAFYLILLSLVTITSLFFFFRNRESYSINESVPVEQVSQYSFNTSPIALDDTLDDSNFNVVVHSSTQYTRTVKSKDAPTFSNRGDLNAYKTNMLWDVFQAGGAWEIDVVFESEVSSDTYIEITYPQIGKYNNRTIGAIVYARNIVPMSTVSSQNLIIKYFKYLQR